jgi:hypothetical protein
MRKANLAATALLLCGMWRAGLDHTSSTPSALSLTTEWTAQAYGLQNRG